MAARASAAEIPSGGDDERLLIEAAKADPQRFGALYERNFDRVYAYVARRSGSRGEAEDLTSEVFHQALANLGRFEWRGVPFAAWLLQIARNAVADRWQRLARERGEPAPGPDVTGAPADVDSHPAGASPFGVEDLVGNVWQWTDEWGDEHTRSAILRGGSHYQPQGSHWYFPQAYKLNEHGKLLLMAPSKDRSGGLGFRCAQDAQ